jgi:tetratricopeptide (TPR) repeat protein
MRACYLSDKAHYRGAAEYLAANARLGDVVLADGEGYRYEDSAAVKQNLSYYLERLGRAEMPVLAVEPGLAQAMALSPPPHGAQVWAVLLASESTGAETDDVVATTPFERLLVVQLRRPTGDVDQDTALMLDALTRLLGEPEARFDIHLALAEFYAHSGNEEEASAQLELAKSSEPDDRVARLDLAAFYAGQGRWGDAVEEYLAFFQEPPSLLEGWAERRAYWELGLAYEQLGSLEQALAAYTKVLDLDPAYWQAYRRVGDLYLGLGQPFVALTAYQRAVDVQPQDAHLLFLLGRTYHSLDRIQEATLAYQQALALDPNNESAKAQLASLSRLRKEEIPHPLFRSFGGDFNLLGYDLRPATPEPGSSLQVVLWWQALASMDRDYTLFIHVVGPDGRLWAQGDSLLEYAELPTSAWPAGLLAENSHQLQLPSDTVPGDYTVLVGVYYWETGQRLPVWDQEGARAADDTIILGSLTLER